MLSFTLTSCRLLLSSTYTRGEAPTLQYLSRRLHIPPYARGETPTLHLLSRCDYECYKMTALRDMMKGHIAAPIDLPLCKGESAQNPHAVEAPADPPPCKGENAHNPLVVQEHIAAARTPWQSCMAYARVFEACTSSVADVSEVPLLKPNDLAWVEYPGLHSLHRHWGSVCKAELG
eukprot:SM000021S06496  [mRNA]  locus=s21:621699:623495:- [translate_table: standard]